MSAPKSLREICSDYFRKNVWENISLIQWAMPKLYNELIHLRKLQFYYNHSNSGHYSIKGAGVWYPKGFCYSSTEIPTNIIRPRCARYTKKTCGTIYDYTRQLFTVRRIDNKIYLWLVFEDYCGEYSDFREDPECDIPEVTVLSKWVSWDVHDTYICSFFADKSFVFGHFNYTKNRQNRYLLDALLDYKLTDPYEYPADC